MKLFDPNNPNEKKKMIAAGVLGLVALLVLSYVFFGGSSPKTATNANQIVRVSPTPNRTGNTVKPPEEVQEDPSIYQPVVPPGTVALASEGSRNIFAYYEPTPAPTKPVIVPSPTPSPTPPLMAYSVNPSNVYARTPADFSLQLMGDKFTPAVQIVIDGREMPTRFINPQQLFTTVPFGMVANPGQRQVMARNQNGQLYSNTVMLNVNQAPPPNYNYVGIIGKPRFNDTAVLQDKSTKELTNVQRGEAVGGRYKVVSISEKEIVLIDTTLKITHKISFSNENSPNSPLRPPVRSVDDEP